MLRFRHLTCIAILLTLAGCVISTTGTTGADQAQAPPGDLRIGGTLDAAGAGDGAVPADAATSPDLATPDLRPALLGLGASCTADAECASSACRPLGPAKALICAQPSLAQSDCDAALQGTFCDPVKAGDASGFCVPTGAGHCRTCSTDADCGDLSARCLQAPGDSAPACHVDCSLSAAACPADYTCSDVSDGGATRKLCVPTGKSCADALGDPCVLGAAPQSCARTAAPGTCTGQRTCLPGQLRYSACNAAQPQYKASCSDPNPPNCTVAFAPNAAMDKNNCGTCGTKCNAGEDCCGGSCKPLDTVSNCGACGTICAAGSGCCSGSCKPLDTVSNCGTCGTSCAAGNGCCSGSCKPLDTVSNCGACGTSCAAGSGCCSGSCKPLNTVSNCGTCGTSCAAGNGCCGGACAPLNTVSNCGACGTSCAAGSGCCSSACTPLNTATNCGSCGGLCPSLGNNDSSCASGSCVMTCRGENYDVDQSVLNGCERLHPTPPGHTTATASSRGNKPCSDAASLDTFSLSGFLSDSRVHQNPVVDGFNAVVGSAPDYWSVVADGGNFCINDYAITFTTTGGSAASCYTLSFITNKLTATATVSGAGTATISSSGSAYSSGTTVYFKIEKTCSLPLQEAVSYTVQYHL